MKNNMILLFAMIQLLSACGSDLLEDSGIFVQPTGQFFKLGTFIEVKILTPARSAIKHSKPTKQWIQK